MYRILKETQKCQYLIGLTQRKPPISPLNTHTKTLFGKARVSFTALSYKTQTYHKTEEAIGYGN